MPAYPYYRSRRVRENTVLRKMLRETNLATDDLIYPLFVTYGENIAKPVAAMPGIMQLSIDMLLKEIKELKALEIPAVMLFGIPEKKDGVGSGAFDKNGVVQQALHAVKEKYPEFVVITDVCLCEYTSHGHCGIVKEGRVLNDTSLEFLARTALSHAQAGADMVAPSDMMDGRVRAVREMLDVHGFAHIPILSYAAKYASSFYGPFREAAGSAPGFGDRSSYQMDPANGEEALREVFMDIEEGADIVMVKPALAYLDIIRRVKEKFGYPLAAYNVSGEYSMVKAAAARGWVDEKNVVLEITTAIKRAGADLVLTYFAKDLAKWLS